MQEIPAERLKKQFDLLGDISNNPIILEYIPPIIEGRSITYRNDVVQLDSSRSVKSQKYFNYIKQYVAFFKSKSYQFLFSDYSLGRLLYEFDEDDKLVSYNMYWNPCPFNKDFIDELKNVGMDILDYIDCIDDKEKLDLNYISLKSPFRLDYSYKYTGTSEDYHPSLHFHIQNSETRMRMDSAFSVYKYYLFVLENCFPEVYRENEFKEYIQYIRKLDSESDFWLKLKPGNFKLANEIKSEMRYVK